MGTKPPTAPHNFTLPRWGNQRLLRCMNVKSTAQIAPIGGRDFGAHDHPHHKRIQQRRTVRDGEGERGGNGLRRLPKVSPTRGAEPEAGGRRIISDGDSSGDGIARTREKVMFHLQMAADQIKDDGKVVSVPPQPQLPNPVAESSDGNPHCPWNLRKRRASCMQSVVVAGNHFARNGSIPNRGGGDDEKGLNVDGPRLHSGVLQTGEAAQKSPIHRCNDAVTRERPERPKFSVSLSKKEIEEDYLAMVGRRAPRRPKKRARVVQRQLDTLFPGLWLTEVTLDMYKVPDNAEL